MNAPNIPLLPEVLLGAQPTDQPNLDLASECVQRYVCHSAHGAMLIEVCDGSALVSGARVTSLAELQMQGGTCHLCSILLHDCPGATTWYVIDEAVAHSRRDDHGTCL